MLKIANKAVTPNGNWRYQVPEGPLIRSGTFGDLLLAVTQHHIANMLPVAGLAELVEEWICRNTLAKCRVVEPSTTADPHEITAADAWRFLKTMATWLAKREVVSQEEADRRSERCAGCRFQSEPPVNCWGCSQLSEMIFQAIGEKRTRFDSQLRFCGVCGCNNKVQAWTPLEVLAAYGKMDDFKNLDTDGRGTPCWKGE